MKALARANNQARIDFRTNAETKLLIERAASLNGMTVSEYAKSILIGKSLEIIDASENRVLSDKDRDKFLALLDNPPSPNDKLRYAVSRFNQNYGADRQSAASIPSNGHN